MTKKPQRKKAAKKAAPKRKTAGRKPLEISLVELGKLAALHCTQEEAAGFLGVSKDTIKRRLKEPKYREAWDNGMATGKVSLRRTQFRLAEKSATMAIFLGKQHLGQKDIVANELYGRGGGPIQTVDMTRLTDKEIEALERISRKLYGANPDAGPDSG